MNDPVQRAQIKEYAHKAFLAKIMQMNEIRQSKKLELRGELGRHGHSLNSSAWMIGEIEIEEDCIADLLRQKAELYIDAYRRVVLTIGPEVLKDIARSQVELTATRKSSLISEAQLLATRTNRVQNLTSYAHLGKKASVAMKEIEANIDLFNLAHSATVTDGARKAEAAQRNLHKDDPTTTQSPALGARAGRERRARQVCNAKRHSVRNQRDDLGSDVVVGRSGNDRFSHLGCGDCVSNLRTTAWLVIDRREESRNRGT